MIALKAKNVMFCAIWFNLYNLTNVNKSNTPPWVFFAFFKLHKWYHIAQNVSDISRKIQALKLYFFHNLRTKNFANQNKNERVFIFPNACFYETSRVFVFINIHNLQKLS